MCGVLIGGVIETVATNPALEAATDEAASCLGSILRADRSLSKLQLDGDKGISEVGWKAIFEGILGNVRTVLSDVSLGRCTLTDSNAECLGAVLRSNSSITRLNLRWNEQVTDRGWKALLDGLKRNKTVVHIDLYNCGQ